MYKNKIFPQSKQKFTLWKVHNLNFELFAILQIFRKKYEIVHQNTIQTAIPSALFRVDPFQIAVSQEFSNPYF
jgi:hypothetical protein